MHSNSGNVSIGFTSENFDSIKAELNRLNIEFNERVEDGGTFIHFSDPDGTSLYFIKPN